MHVKCVCGATCWVQGTYEADTNATVLDDSRVWEWEGGDPTCIHADDEITDEALPVEDDWV